MDNSCKKLLIPCLILISTSFIACAKKTTSTLNEHDDYITTEQKIIAEKGHSHLLIVGPERTKSSQEECPCVRKGNKYEQQITVPYISSMKSNVFILD